MSHTLDVSGMLPLGQKRKMLNEFIGRAEEHELDNLLSDCHHQPSTLFNLIKFMLADKFHRFDLMIELLQEDDKTILSEVLSKRWMYEGEEYSLTDSHFLLDTLFPNVSYNCRRKVLHKIGRYVRNEVKVDEIWNAVERKYGFNAAFPLFQACSKDIISSVIANRKINLSGYQLVQILQKYPDIGLQYLKDNTVKCSKMNPHCSPLHYLYKHRFDDFLDLCMNHSYKIGNFKIGRRRSTKMIRAHRSTLIEHPNKTSELLKFDRIKREFSAKEFQILFESTLPKKPGSVESLWKWVLTAPLYQRINMVNGTYQNLYRINLEEHPEYMTAEYIFLLPVEKRLSAIEWKTQNVKAGSSWSLKGLSGYSYDANILKYVFLPLKPISHSAPELKKLLLIEQDVAIRATLSKHLIHTCYINADLPELLKVLEFLSKRSRNDQSDVRETIFASLCDIMNGMEFSEEHWTIIIEMIQVSLVFKDTVCDSEIERIIGKYIVFRLESKLPVDDLIGMHIKLKIQNRYCDNRFDLADIKNLAVKRILLELYAKALENLHLTNNLCDFNGKALGVSRLAEFVFQLVKKMVKFNEESDVEPISLASHPWLISNFEGIAKKEEAQLDERCREPPARRPPKRSRYGRRRRANSFWGRGRPNQCIKIIEWLRQKEHLNLDAFNGSDYYFSKMWLCLPNHATILHFLEKNPSHLTDNWSASILKMLETKACVALMKTMRTWNYSFLVGETIKKCTELMYATLDDNDDETLIQRKCNAVRVLSALKGPPEFLSLVAEYYPPENTADVFAEKSGEQYRMRETIAKSLINISVPHLAFDAIKKFCVGDYLKLTIDSLYSQMYRAVCFASLDFLREKLINVPVSLQKHMIRLYCTISSLDEKRVALKYIESSNATIRYVVFLESSSLFRLYPSEETWTMLNTIMDRTTADDECIVKFFYSTPMVDTCPIQFISEYVDACLTLLRKFEPKKIDKFMEFLEKVIATIPAHTLDKIVMHNFGDSECFNSTFNAAYLRCSSSESILRCRLPNVWRLLDNIIRNGTTRKTLILDFIRDLCMKIRHPEKVWLEKTIYQTLLGELQARSKPIFFSEILALHMALLNTETVSYCGTVRLREFGSRLAGFVDSLADTYGQDVIFIAKVVLALHVKQFFSDEISRDDSVLVELVDGMLETSKSKSNLIVSMKILSESSYPKRDNTIQMWIKIHKIYQESNDFVVKTYYCASWHLTKGNRYVYHLNTDADGDT